MHFDTKIRGISAKELHEKYPALGGYPVICKLIREGDLVPFKILKIHDSGEYTVEHLPREHYRLAREHVLGKPVGKQLFQLWDGVEVGTFDFYAPEDILFDAEDLVRILKVYPAIATSDNVLFSVNPKTGEFIHHENSLCLPSDSTYGEEGDLTWLFSERDQMQNELKEANSKIAQLEREIAHLNETGSGSDKTRAARDQKAAQTAENWAAYVGIGGKLTSVMISRYNARSGAEPWARDGFTNAEIKDMADGLGSMPQRALKAFKKSFGESFPEIPIKRGSGVRRS